MAEKLFELAELQGSANVNYCNPSICMTQRSVVFFRQAPVHAQEAHGALAAVGVCNLLDDAGPVNRGNRAGNHQRIHRVGSVIEGPADGDALVVFFNRASGGGGMRRGWGHKRA